MKTGKLYTRKSNVDMTWLVMAMLIVAAIMAITPHTVHALQYVTPILQTWTESMEHSEKLGNSLSGCELIGGYNAEVITCDTGTDETKRKVESEDNPSVSPVQNNPIVQGPVVTVENPTIEEPTIDNPVIDEPINEEPVIEEPQSEEPATSGHTNNGNHYGNDTPDNNPKDENNKHNGCDSSCTGQDVK